MKKKLKLTRILFIIGIVALVVGILDPLEGSIVIAAGSGLIALSTFLEHDPQWKVFVPLFIAIAAGVFFLFYLSSLGGFGGNSKLSWWWGILVIPYPLGWLVSIIMLIIRAVQKKKQQPA
jgi:hypothetical protein